MINKDILVSIAKNAKIAMTDSETNTVLAELNGAIKMISIIEELDLTEVEPLFYPNEQAYEFRDEQMLFVQDAADLLANTVETLDNQFKVPNILMGGKSE
ncbi:hypothetical protein AwErysi_02530 [Erysipelotrichaceae bacterium]|nr:hypothetical protein AwErysi_02530 [Erysipelotrichaceae bacterium]